MTTPTDPPNLDALTGDAPQLGQSPATFDTNANTLIGQLPALQTGINEVADWTNGVKTWTVDQVAAVADSAAAAAASETAATGAVNYQGDYDAGTLYAIGESVTYTGAQFVKKTTAPAGTTPVDGTDWLEVDLLTPSDFASQAEAETGTNNSKVMTPLRTAQAVLELSPAAGMAPIGSRMTVSDVAAVDVILPSGFDEYVIKIWDFIPSNSYASMFMQTSSDGGSSFDAGASDYGYGAYCKFTESSGVLAFGSTSTGLMFIASASAGGADGVSNISGVGGASGDIKVFSPGKPIHTNASWDLSFPRSASGLGVSVSGSGLRRSAAGVDAVRLGFAIGNISSGTYQLYGVSPQ